MQVFRGYKGLIGIFVRQFVCLMLHKVKNLRVEADPDDFNLVG